MAAKNAENAKRAGRECKGIGEMALVRAGVVGYISRPLTGAQQCQRFMAVNRN